MPAAEGSYEGNAGIVGAWGLDTQAGYLLDSGIWDRINDAGPVGSAGYNKAYEAAKAEMGAQAIVSDTTTGMSLGGGAIGGLVGLFAAGTLVMIDAIVMGVTLDEEFTKGLKEAGELHKRIEDIMSLREGIESKLAQYTSPLEQAARVRAKAFGRQAAASGLTGVQALQAQEVASQTYRSAIGPQLANVVETASAAARQDALAKLQALEKGYGINLAMESAAISKAGAGSAAGKIAGGIANMADGIGTSIGFLAGMNKSKVQQQTQSSPSEQTQSTANYDTTRYDNTTTDAIMEGGLA